MWDWGQEERKIAWVNWETICKSKEEGGLEIKYLTRFNLTLVAKWIWRLGMKVRGYGWILLNLSMVLGET